MNPIHGLRELETRINVRTRRERLLLAGALVAVVLVAWDSAVRAPLTQERARALQQMAQARVQVSQLDASTAQLQGQLDALSGNGRARRLEDLHAQIERVDRKLKERTARVISPVQMVKVLRDVLAGDERLKLVALRNTGVDPVITEDQPAKEGTQAPAKDGVPRVFRHHVEVVVQGRYLALLDYLERLEGLRWQFQWDALRIETVEYPTARATIDLSTLSLAEDWIGV